MGIIEVCLGKGGKKNKDYRDCKDSKENKDLRTVSIIVALDGIEMGKDTEIK